MEMNQEILKTLLPYAVKGGLTLDVAKTFNVDTINHAVALGLIYKKDQKDGNGEISIRESNVNKFNIDGGVPHYDKTALYSKWIELDAEQNLAEINEYQFKGLTFIKVSGDDYGQIITEENCVVAYVRMFKDTRCPWVDIEGDTRPLCFGVTNMTRPDDIGRNHPLEGWKRHEEVRTISRNGKTFERNFTVNYFGETKITLKDLQNEIPSLCYKLLGEKVEKTEKVFREKKIVDKVEFSIRDRIEFRRGENYMFSSSDLNLEISKVSGSFEGDLIIDADNKIGSVRMQEGLYGKYKLFVNVEEDKIPDGFEKADIINAAQAAVKNGKI